MYTLTISVQSDPLFSFYSCLSGGKKITLSHVYCYPIWKYFYYCDIKYFHCILRMQTKNMFHYHNIIKKKNMRILKARVKSDSWTITVKVYNNTQYYTLTRAFLTSQSAKYLLEESGVLSSNAFRRRKNTAWQHFSQRAALREVAQ